MLRDLRVWVDRPTPANSLDRTCVQSMGSKHSMRPPLNPSPSLSSDPLSSTRG